MEISIFLIFSGLFSFGAFFYISLKKKMEEASKENSLLLQKEQELKNALKKEEASHKESRERLNHTEKKLKKHETKKIAQKRVQATKVEPNEDLYKEENTKLKRASEHLEEQTKVLIEQIKEKEEAYVTLKKEVTKQTKRNEENLEVKLLNLRQEQGKLKEKALEQKKKNNKALLELKLDKKNQEKKVSFEIKKIKKKLKDYQHFYSMSASQKKLLEDKITNWEKALIILSSWVLKREREESGMGEFVAEAIEKTGYGSLVKDEFDFKETIPRKPIHLTNPLESRKQTNV